MKQRHPDTVAVAGMTSPEATRFWVVVDLCRLCGSALANHDLSTLLGDIRKSEALLYSQNEELRKGLALIEAALPLWRLTKSLQGKKA